MTGTDFSTAALPRPRGSGRPRRVVLALTIVVTTVLVLWGIDWTARLGAQTLLARELQHATRTGARPAVEINGSLFLVQVLRGRYDEVQVDVADLAAGPLRVQNVHAELGGVYVSFHDLLLRSVDRVFVERSLEEAFVTYDEVNRYLSATGHAVTLASSSGGRVKMIGSVDVLGRPVSASAVAQLAPDGSVVDIAPTSIETGSTVLDSVAQAVVVNHLSVQIPLDGLPFGQQITAVEAQATGILVRAEGADFVINT